MLGSFGKHVVTVGLIALVLPGLKCEVTQCTLHRGRCLYHVQLASPCHDALPGPGHTNRLQNDHDQKITEISQTITSVRAQHDERLQQLENKISTLISEKSQPGHTNGNTVNRQYTHLEEKPSRGENGLLNQLHEEFSRLRKDLAHAHRKLREKEKLLLDTRAKLNKSEDMLTDTTRKLLSTQKKYAASDEENGRLEHELQKQKLDLDDTKYNFANTLEKLHHTKYSLSVALEEKAVLQKDLAATQESLERARTHLAQALRKYHELNLKHESVTNRLRRREEELVKCYRGKTSLFCGFEHPDICGFKQENGTDLFDWTRKRGRTPSGRTGPTHDHTCKSGHGHYMYIEASTKPKGHNARMVSPRYRSMTDQCVEFYYHMYGRHIGTLNVYTRVPGQNVVPLWRGFGNQGNTWIRARIPIPIDVATKSYEVVFEGITERGYQGDIAVDDFRTFDGPCYIPPKTQKSEVKHADEKPGVTPGLKGGRTDKTENKVSLP